MNVQGLKSKLDDCDFFNFISDYDILLFSECWHSKLSNIDIEGYSHFSCPRPKFNRKAKRNSGGVIVYFKNILSSHLELVNVNQNGIIWFKLNKTFLLTDNDAYICLSYVPPEDSSVYKNINSTLFEFDFFQHLSNDIRYYNTMGDVFLHGDMNSRTGQLSDCVDDINLDRYVNMPEDDLYGINIPPRANSDTHVNAFGNKLLTLCKENNVQIVNGRLMSGNCTYHGLYRNRHVQSTIDYLITNINNFKPLTNVHIFDLTEFSDHCSITFSLKCSLNNDSVPNHCNVDKIIWNSAESDSFNTFLYTKKTLI